MVIYCGWDFSGVEYQSGTDRPPLREASQAERAAEASRHRGRFGALREARKVRNFQVELCASVWDPVGEYSVRMLKEAVAEEKAKGGFDGCLSEPSVTYDPQRSRL